MAQSQTTEHAGDVNLKRHDLGIVGFVALAGLMILAFTMTPLSLAMISGTLLLVGFALATIARLRGDFSVLGGTSARDAGGLFVFLGFAAAILCGPASRLI